MKSYFLKTIYLLILLSILINPILIIAEESTNQPPRALPVNEQTLTPEFINSEIQSGMSQSSVRQQSSSQESSGPTLTGAKNIAGCGAGQILSNIILSSVSSAAGQVKDKVSDLIFTVPVAESGSVGANIKTDINARTGLSFGIAGISTLVAPSWDSIAYCIVNAMIAYIADSTIEWINSGFNGNPAFLSNPDSFFKQLADDEAAGFMQSLAYGANNICELFKATIVLTTVRQYSGNNYGNYNTGYGGCTFDNGSQILERFTSGDFIQGGGWNTWYQLSQNRSNNPYDVYFNVNDELTKLINKTLSSANRELGWNNGFLTFKKCSDPKDKTTCTAITPGKIISDQVTKTLNLGTDRLILADKFDQVVTALVNQLITTALGRALESVHN